MTIVVLVTIPEDTAEDLAKILLEKRLCACINITPKVKSLFWWDGKLDQAEEVLLVIKTKEELFLSLEEAIKENHPYEVPEIISFKIDRISKEYLQWLEGEVSANE